MSTIRSAMGFSAVLSVVRFYLFSFCVIVSNHFLIISEIIFFTHQIICCAKYSSIFQHLKVAAESIKSPFAAGDAECYSARFHPVFSPTFANHFEIRDWKPDGTACATRESLMSVENLPESLELPTDLPDGAHIISSSSRNLKAYPFVPGAHFAMGIGNPGVQILGAVEQMVLSTIMGVEGFEKSQYFHANNPPGELMGAINKFAKVVANAIKPSIPAHVPKHRHRGFILNEDETILVAINQFEHLTVYSHADSCTASLTQLHEVMQKINEKLADHYAHDTQLNYLTADPAILGCGFRCFAILADGVDVQIDPKPTEDESDALNRYAQHHKIFIFSTSFSYFF